VTQIHWAAPKIEKRTATRSRPREFTRPEAERSVWKGKRRDGRASAKKLPFSSVAPSTLAFYCGGGAGFNAKKALGRDRPSKKIVPGKGRRYFCRKKDVAQGRTSHLTCVQIAHGKPFRTYKGKVETTWGTTGGCISTFCERL